MQARIMLNHTKNHTKNLLLRNHERPHKLPFDRPLIKFKGKILAMLLYIAHIFYTVPIYIYIYTAKNVLQLNT